MYLGVHVNRALFFFIVITNLCPYSYANCPYCNIEGETVVCEKCQESLKKIKFALEGRETEISIDCRIPPVDLPGQSSLSYPTIKDNLRTGIESLSKCEPYSLGNDMVRHSVPIIHNVLLNLRPQFKGIQGIDATVGEVVFEHIQPGLLSESISCSQELTHQVTPFLVGINNLIHQVQMSGTAESWMSIVHAASNFDNENPVNSHFIWITHYEDEDEDEQCWIFIVIHSDGTSLLFNWNFHPNENNVIAVNRFQTKPNLIQYLRQMLRNEDSLRSGYY